MPGMCQNTRRRRRKGDSALVSTVCELDGRRLCRKETTAPKSSGRGHMSGTPGSNRRPSPWQFGRPGFTDLPDPPLRAQVFNFTRDRSTRRPTNLPYRIAATRISGSNRGPRCPPLGRCRRAPDWGVHRDHLQALRARRAAARPAPECHPDRPGGSCRVHAHTAQPWMSAARPATIGHRSGLRTHTRRASGPAGSASQRDHCCRMRSAYSLRCLGVNVSRRVGVELWAGAHLVIQKPGDVGLPLFVCCQLRSHSHDFHRGPCAARSKWMTLTSGEVGR